MTEIRYLGQEHPKRKVMILGTEYAIEIHDYETDKSLINNSWSGYCVSDYPLIVIADFDNGKYFDFQNEEDKDNYFKTCLRHEIIHAFLNESGLKDCSGGKNPWSKNEEMVDWMAIQFPKMQNVFEELGVL